MIVLSEISKIRDQVSQWKKEGLSVGFVPTMGALHVGHESLLLKASQECDRVVVSVFVNPIQFGPNEDFDKYPRILDSDSLVCEKAGAHLIFAPSVAEMYVPENKELENIRHGSDLLSKSRITRVVPPIDYVNKLCGKSRVGHFEGVATVVLKLFNIVQPDKAFFGQKDAQQLVIIKKICKDLNVPVEIIGCPIKRDPDGLACSSRNSYLSSESRQKALSLFKVLSKIKEMYNNGSTNRVEILNSALKSLDSDAALEYLEIMDADTLEDLDELRPNMLVAIAANIGGVRLIDNIIIDS